MPILVGRRLQVRHLGHVARRQRRPEVGQVVLMVGLVGVPDHGYRARWQVVWIGRRGVVLERLVMGAVVLLHWTEHAVGALDLMRGRTLGRSTAARVIWTGGRKATLEPTPGRPRAVE